MTKRKYNIGLAFKILKRSCKIGDRVVITSSTGTSEGIILDMDDGEVALELDNGGFVTTRGDDIIAMKTINVAPPIEESINSQGKEQDDSISVDSTIDNSDNELKPPIEESQQYPAHIIEGKIIGEIAKDIISDTSKGKVLDEDEEIVDDNSNQSVSPKTKSISPDELLAMQWKDSRWKRQTYRKMQNAIEQIGDYRNENEFKKGLPVKGQFSPSTNGIIIDSVNGNKYIYNTDELLLPKHLYGKTVYFIKANGLLKDCLPARKISDIIGILETLIRNEQLGNTPKLPIRVVGVLLHVLPDNLTLAQLLDNLRNIIYNFSIDSHSVPRERTASEKSSDSNSASLKAKRLSNQRRHEEALPYYLEAISKGDKIESCIHDAASTYLALYKQALKSSDSNAAEKAEKWRQSGITFMQEHRKLLPNETNTIFLLENFYYSIRDYDSFFDILPRVMSIGKVKNNSIMWSNYMNKKASALIALQRYEEAQQTINEALKANPDNVGAQRILEVLNQLNQLNMALEHADDKKREEIKEELEKKIKSIEFSSFTDGGLGIFITQTIEEYTEMEGLSEFVKAKQDYTEVTLRTIRNRIAEAGKSRPAERAKLILTEVKLMQMLDVDNDRKTIHGEMAHYCQAMAELSLYQNDIDVARFYYDQSFALEQNYETSTDRYICVYLQTLSYTPKEILDEIFKTPPTVEEMVDRVLGENITLQQWEAIITLLLYNNDVAGKIVPCLYHNEKLRRQSFELMKDFKISQKTDDSEAEFIKGWERVRTKRTNDRRRISNQIKSLIDSCTKLEDVNANMRDTLETCRHEEWLSNTLDLQRIGAIIDTILNPVSTYIASKGFTHKFNARNNINSQIKAIQDEIRHRPTKLSYEAILPLLNHIHQLVEDAFSTVVLTSKPKITISLPANETVVERGNMVSLQVKIGNDENSAPINNVTVEIKTTNGVLSDSDNTKENGIQIEGGKEHIFKHRIKVSDSVIRNEGTSVDIICYYRDREGKVADAKESRTLTLYSRDNYQDIENPYRCSDKLSSTDSTFKGRSADIKVVVDEIKKVKPGKPGYQVIIFGQKRCGKSSVLERIKTQLEGDGYFCIDFSLDKIARSINEFTFYHLILKTLHMKLSNLNRHRDDPEIVKQWGNQIPIFDLPNITDFEKEDPYNPAITFEVYMGKFRAACEKIPQWRERRIVLMIDEFTAIYTGVEKKRIDPSIMKQWKAITQNPACNFSVVLVGQDVTPAFIDKPYAANAFRIIAHKRLTYLPLSDARDLVVDPMTMACGGQSPYIGKAIERIIDYTSSNPYYIQLLCTHLVNYMNEHHLKKVTEADVDDLADIMLADMKEGDFDNLINPGEEEEDNPDYQHKKNDIKSVLIAMAKLSKGRGYDFCSNNDIDGIADKSKQLGILEELFNREVLAKEEGSYKIRVRLFKEWLIRQ